MLDILLHHPSDGKLFYFEVAEEVKLKLPPKPGSSRDAVCSLEPGKERVWKSIPMWSI